MNARNVVFSLTVVMSALIAAAAAAEIVRITNGEWPPFTSERLKYSGVISRIVSESFALEGISVEYGYFPWKRAYQVAKSGEWDGSVGWALTPDHLKDFYMSDPVVLVDKVCSISRVRPSHGRPLRI